MRYTFITSGSSNNSQYGLLAGPVKNVSRAFAKPVSFDDQTKTAVSWWFITADGTVYQVNSYSGLLGDKNSPKAYKYSAEELYSRMESKGYREVKPGQPAEFPAIDEAGNPVLGQIEWPSFLRPVPAATPAPIPAAPAPEEQQEQQE